MAKVENRIVCQIYPNKSIREWHTTARINMVPGICCTVECEPGAEPTAKEWSGRQSTSENSPKAFALAAAISTIPGVKEVKVGVYDVHVEKADAFDFDRDGIADRIVLEIRRHVYSLRQKVAVSDHLDNATAIHHRHSPPRDYFY
jgi:hypothetical protein